jgi:signal transduction histidine kinase
MVSNVLSMRNMETGKLEMHPAAFDPHAALNDLLQVCRLGCSQSENIMWTNASEPLPASVTADRSFFTGVLQNLVRLQPLPHAHAHDLSSSRSCCRSRCWLRQITNALKFEEGQGVFVSLSCALLSAGDVAAAAAAVDDGADAPTHVLEARVTDHGCGLTPQQCDRIFEAYEAAAAASGGGALVFAWTCC